jgi:hypothetical protein
VPILPVPFYAIRRNSFLRTGNTVLEDKIPAAGLALETRARVPRRRD